jgi:hypothetical protein
MNGDVFVVTWYDQSGNNKNPTQTTAGNQPRLVSSATADLEKSGGKVAVRFIKSASNFLNIADNTANINNMSSYWVGQYATTADANIGYSLSGGNTTNRFYFPAINSGVSSGIYSAYASTILAVLLDTLSNTNRKLFELISPSPLNSSVVQGWTNGTAKGTRAISSGATATITLGATNTANSFDGHIQEVIGYQSNANRIEKENNINSYWTIY